MPLKEVLYNHPLMLAMGCMVWIPVAIWVLALISWMIEGEIEPLFGVPACLIAVALGYTTINPPSPALSPLIFLAAVGTLVAFPLVRQTVNKRQLVAIDVEKVEDAYEMLALKPDNVISRWKLAKTLYEMGQIDAGLAIGQVALQSMPERVFTDEHRMFGTWKRQNRQANPDKAIVCVACGHANSSGQIYCERCGASYLIDLARGRWMGKEFARKVIAAWGAGVAALVGIPLASQLPPIPAVIVIVALMIGAIALLWNAFRASRGPTQK